MDLRVVVVPDLSVVVGAGLVVVRTFFEVVVRTFFEVVAGGGGRGGWAADLEMLNIFVNKKMAIK